MTIPDFLTDLSSGICSRIISLTAAVLFCIGCFNPESSQNKVSYDAVYEGIIDDNMERKILLDLKKGHRIKFSSIGGEVFSSLRIATKIQQKKIVLIVDKNCFSACPEFLLPAASKIIFQKKPLIGFHGNPRMKEWLANHYEIPELPYCDFDEVSQMFDIYIDNDLNLEFWRKQLDVLKLKQFYVDPNTPKGNCPLMGLKFKHEMWFPDSKTLQTDLGLKFEGSVCADDFDECAQRVKKLFPDRGTFVVGDKVVDTRTNKSLK